MDPCQTPANIIAHANCIFSCFYEFVLYMTQEFIKSQFCLHFVARDSTWCHAAPDYPMIKAGRTCQSMYFTIITADNVVDKASVVEQYDPVT